MSITQKLSATALINSHVPCIRTYADIYSAFSLRGEQLYESISLEHSKEAFVLVVFVRKDLMGHTDLHQMQPNSLGV